MPQSINPEKHSPDCNSKQATTGHFEAGQFLIADNLYLWVIKQEASIASLTCRHLECKRTAIAMGFLSSIEIPISVLGPYSWRSSARKSL
jgi:hypothetical protein